MKTLALKINWAVIPIVVILLVSTFSIVPIVNSDDILDIKNLDPAGPFLYWIGFNETDAPRTPRMDQQVPPDTSYYFRYEANYSEGWSNTITEIRAWYDLGLTGLGGSSYPPEVDANRNLAFTIFYDPFIPAAWVSYPGGALEVDVNPVVSDVVSWVHPTNPGIEDYHEVEILVTLGPQIRAANYGGVAPAGPPFDKNPAIALNNPFSWDFNITVRDTAMPTESNTTYGEFGIEPDVAISVSGNPTGNAPPGSSNTLLTNPSLITYSSNTDYWVNVSIPNLLKDGVGPQNIPAVDISVWNLHIHAGVAGVSDIAGRTWFGFSGDELCVWGTEFPSVPLNPVGNGTQSAGPFASNYNSPGTWDYTQMDWWVDVQATTVEGIYWATITYTIEAFDGSFAIEQSTTITVNVVFPKLYWIGFNETDPGRTSRLNQEVAADNSYYVRWEYNYSNGYLNTQTEIKAWYDWGNTDLFSAYPAEADADRNLAFSIIYDPNTVTAALQFPIAPILEVSIGLVNDQVTGTPWPADPGQDYHTVEVEVILGPQIRAADGSGFMAGDASYGTPAQALQDPWSWDFSITVRETILWFVYNTSYGEFGIEKAVSISSVTGNPTVTAMAGDSNVPLGNSSIITYSANTNYWVNVSIPDLLKDGVGPESIPAVNVSVRNMHIHADFDSDIAAQTYFGFSGDEMCVWGQEAPAVPLAPVGNGTQTAGPFASDYNYPGSWDFTQVDWWVTVPNGTAEGVYWGNITYTIEAPNSVASTDQSTEIIVNVTNGGTDINPPEHSNEFPPIDGYTTDLTPVISVHVTDISGVNESTIKFYIQGFRIFHDISAILGGYNVSYWHESGFSWGEVVTCRIKAEDIYGNELDFTWNFTVLADFEIQLHEGWNLISFPLVPSDTSIESVLNSIDGNWDYVQYYDASDVADHWKSYATFKPSSLNDLWALDNTMGFWLHVTNASSPLVVGGTEPVSTTIPLYAGWNLVGYPTLNTTTTIENALWGTGADRVEGFDPDAPYLLKELPPTYVMMPGEGYWVHVAIDSAWTVDW